MGYLTNKETRYLKKTYKGLYTSGLEILFAMGLLIPWVISFFISSFGTGGVEKALVITIAPLTIFIMIVPFKFGYYKISTMEAFIKRNKIWNSITDKVAEIMSDENFDIEFYKVKTKKSNKSSDTVIFLADMVSDKLIGLEVSELLYDGTLCDEIHLFCNIFDVKLKTKAELIATTFLKYFLAGLIYLAIVGTAVGFEIHDRKIEESEVMVMIANTIDKYSYNFRSSYEFDAFESSHNETYLLNLERENTDLSYNAQFHITDCELTDVSIFIEYYKGMPFEDFKELVYNITSTVEQVFEETKPYHSKDYKLTTVTPSIEILEQVYNTPFGEKFRTETDDYEVSIFKREDTVVLNIDSK